MLAIVVLVSVLSALGAMIWLIVKGDQPPAPISDATPDRPRAFGTSMAWIAVRTNDTGRVARALGLEDCKTANWASGVATIYDHKLANNRIFVTPPLGNWVLIAGLAVCRTCTEVRNLILYS